MKPQFPCSKSLSTTTAPRLGRAARWLRTLALAGVATLALPACSVGGGDRSWLFDPPLTGTDVHLGSGNIDVLPSNDGSLRVDWSGGGVGFGDVQPQPEVVDGVLYIDARCGGSCGGDVTLWLPDGTDLSAMVDVGEVNVELAEPADVRACASLGDVELDVPGGAWRLSLTAAVGKMSVEGVHNDPGAEHRLDACVAAGSLTVTGH